MTMNEYEEIIRRMENHITRTIDGKVLSSLISMIYRCALKPSEIRNLSIKHVYKKGKVSAQITLDDGSIPIANPEQDLLQGHLEYLKQKGYSTKANSPLFPNRRKEQYSTRLLQIHLEKFFHFEARLEKIRQEGIRKYYKNLIDQGISEGKAIESTAKFARSSVRHTNDILRDQIRYSGSREGSFNTLKKAIEKFTSNPELRTQNQNERAAEKILKRIAIKDKLGGPQKEELEEEVKLALQSNLESLEDDEDDFF